MALRLLEDEESRNLCRDAAERGIVWLLDLQNRDGGMPTFCRGWGALPFDRSSPDLTAHALRAWTAWSDEMPVPLQDRIKEGTRQALRFLKQHQRGDGSWVPLWFGNQHLRRDEENPTYGTSMVAIALMDLEPNLKGPEREALARGINWLRAHQNADGGWGAGEGTPSSIEETALAMSALGNRATIPVDIMQRAADWLAEATEQGTSFPASPIGFYFAKLWYFEKLYPKVWTVSALSRFERLT